MKTEDQILHALGLLREAYDKVGSALKQAETALELAELRNRWYHARLTELLAAPDLNLEDLAPATVDAIKNANNLLEGLAQK